jgi:hypothetical protein
VETVETILEWHLRVKTKDDQFTEHGDVQFELFARAGERHCPGPERAQLKRAGHNIGCQALIVT